VHRYLLKTGLLALSLVTVLPAAVAMESTAPRPRAREAGIIIGQLPTGPDNAITDVPGVRVGQTTVVIGNTVRTGVTAILPHDGNLFQSRVPAAIEVGNGFGKLLGISQVRELGELETPILLTGTLAVWKAADAMVDWMLRQPGMEQVPSINPVVGETNDGFLNDIRSRPLLPEHVVGALESAAAGRVEEGAVGAGTGTTAFGWKGGIGTSSRRLPDSGYTVGVLVQTNFGGHLTIAGVPMAARLPDPRSLVARSLPLRDPNGDGSITMVVATDAPLDPRQLGRLARRALMGLARTGSVMEHGSGDYVIAFSNAAALRHAAGETPNAPLVRDTALSPLFDAVADATEEAILNSLFKARTVTGHRGTVPALPLEPVLNELRRAGAIK
jgi:D-aminopeptidase